MENSPETQSNKWLIIFLIYADFTTSEKLPMIEKMRISINSMLGDIINTPIVNDRVRLFVVLNSIKFISRSPENKITDKTVFYEIENINPETNAIKSCKLINKRISHNDSQDLQKIERLKSILKKTKVKDDEEILLVTQDHGSAFGIFREEPHILNANSIRIGFDDNSYKYPYLNLFWEKATAKGRAQYLKKASVKNDYTTVQVGASLVKLKNDPLNFKILEFYKKRQARYVFDIEAQKIKFINAEEILSNAKLVGDIEFAELLAFFPDAKLPEDLDVEQNVAEILKNDELNKCLDSWLGEKKVGVLLMSNCWMMNLHTMYALRNSVKCLVAPQGNIDCPGYNIRDILIEINKRGNLLTPAELSKICVETIDNEFSMAKARFLSYWEPDVLKRFKIFAADLSKTVNGESSLEIQIDLLSDVIDRINSELIKQETDRDKSELIFYLKYIRSSCFDFSDTHAKMIDIITWAQALLHVDDQLERKDKQLPGGLSVKIQLLIDSVINNVNSPILASSKGAKVYDLDGDDLPYLLPIELSSSNEDDNSHHLSVIGSSPTGYSFFFPIADCSHSIDSTKLKDNVKSDELLKKLANWREFLKKIDPEIDNIFIPAST